MSNQYYPDDKIEDIEYQINRVVTEVQRIDPEAIENKKDAQSVFDNVLMGVYNLRDEMGLD